MYTSSRKVQFTEHGDPLLDKLREMIKAANPGKPVVDSRTPTIKKSGPSATRKPAIPELKSETIKKESKSQITNSQSDDAYEFEDCKAAYQAITAAFDLSKDRRMRDDRGNDVGVRERTAKVLELDPSQAADLSEGLALFLTKRREYRDLAKLLKVFQELKVQKKHDEARRIGDIMNRLLPLCLPQKLAADASRQLTQDRQALLRTRVGGRTGAELIVARLFQQEADFDLDRLTGKPKGTMLAAFYEDAPIDDPEANQAAMLRGLFAATHPQEVKLDEHGNFQVLLPFDQIKPMLNGYFQSERDLKDRPWYCVVQLPTQESDANNLARFLKELNLPDLLFIGIASRPDESTTHIERYIGNILNTRFRYDNESTPS